MSYIHDIHTCMHGGSHDSIDLKTFGRQRRISTEGMSAARSSYLLHIYSYIHDIRKCMHGRQRRTSTEGMSAVVDVRIFMSYMTYIHTYIHIYSGSVVDKSGESDDGGDDAWHTVIPRKANADASKTTRRCDSDSDLDLIYHALCIFLFGVVFSKANAGVSKTMQRCDRPCFVYFVIWFVFCVQ
jgi:hypothetical protein